MSRRSLVGSASKPQSPWVIGVNDDDEEEKEEIKAPESPSISNGGESGGSRLRRLFAKNNFALNDTSTKTTTTQLSPIQEISLKSPKPPPSPLPLAQQEENSSAGSSETRSSSTNKSSPTKKMPAKANNNNSSNNNNKIGDIGGLRSSKLNQLIEEHRRSERPNYLTRSLSTIDELELSIKSELEENTEKEPEDTSWYFREKSTQTEDDFGIEDVDDDQVFQSLFADHAKAEAEAAEEEEGEDDNNNVDSIKAALDDAAFMARLSDPDPRGFTGLHKVCRIAKDGDTDPAWDDVRRYFNLADEDAQKKATKKKQFGGLLPLHLACRKNPPRDIIDSLLDLNPDALHTQNKAGMLPIHTACLNSAPFYVIQLLVQNAGEECLMTKDKTQRLPLHCAYKTDGCSPRAISYLLDVGGVEMLLDPDRNQRLPISRSKMYFDSVDRTSRSNMKDAEVLLKDYILPCPYWDDHSEDLFFMIRKLHIRLQVASINTPRSRKMADMHFLQRPCTILTALDFDFHLFLVIGYSLASSDAVYNGQSIDHRAYRVLLSIGLCWHGMRNVLRMLVLRYPIWIADFWNWLDSITILLATYTTYYIFASENLGNGARNVIAFTTASLWFLFLKRLRNAFFFISIFLGAMEYVLFALVPFFITITILLSGFAQAFYIANVESSYCAETANAQLDWFCGDSGGLLGKIHGFLYSTLINGVEVYVVGKGNAATTVLLYMFGFIFGFFFLNILIAIMTSTIRRAEEYGMRSYVRNRFLFVAETRAIMTDYHPNKILPRILILCLLACAKCITFLAMICARAIYKGIRYYLCCCFFPEEEDDEDDDDDLDQDNNNNNNEQDRQPSEEKKKEEEKYKVDVLELFYGPEEWSENRTISGDGFQAFCYRVMVPIGMIIWFLGGLLFGGLLWPMWMKEALFHYEGNHHDGNDARDLWEEKKKNPSMHPAPSSPPPTTATVADVDLSLVTEQIESLRGDFLETKIETMQKSLDDKVDGIENKMNGRLDHLQKKMDENNMVLLEILRLLQAASAKQKKRRTTVSIASSGGGGGGGGGGHDSLSTLGASFSSSMSANT